MVRSGDWVSDGWTLIKPHLGTHILIALVVGILSSVTLGILSGPLVCGWLMILLRQRREPSYTPQFGDLWKGFEIFGQAFVAWLVIAIVSAIAGALTSVVGTILGYIPIIGWIAAPLLGAVVAICLMTVFLYAFPLLADRRADAIEAIKRSAETTTPEFIPFAGFAVILYLLQLVGGVACGIGLLITGPIMIAALAVSYTDVLGDEATPRPAPDEHAAPPSPTEEAEAAPEEPGADVQEPDVGAQEPDTGGEEPDAGGEQPQ